MEGPILILTLESEQTKKLFLVDDDDIDYDADEMFL
jgi:hypothetical protein